LFDLLDLSWSCMSPFAFCCKGTNTAMTSHSQMIFLAMIPFMDGETIRAT
jgi:hypothetical protein